MDARTRSRQRLGAAGGVGVGRTPSCTQTQPRGSQGWGRPHLPSPARPHLALTSRSRC